METKITDKHLNWIEVKNVCRTTMNKEHTDKEPTDNFKTNLLIAEHSPICKLTVSWLWKNMKSWVSVHFVRHWLGWNKFVSTQRTDRTGIDRNKMPQDTPVVYAGEANAQALINVAKKRLCFQASNETRLYMEDLKSTIKNEVDKNIALVMVPSCIYRMGCPEMTMCETQLFIRFKQYVKDNNINIDTIRRRYEAYEQFRKEIKL